MSATVQVLIGLCRTKKQPGLVKLLSHLSHRKNRVWKLAPSTLANLTGTSVVEARALFHILEIADCGYVSGSEFYWREDSVATSKAVMSNLRSMK